MKVFITAKQIRYETNAFKVDYGTLKQIFRTKSPDFYNYGVYGWNFDAYYFKNFNITISEGYRNVPGKRIAKEIIEEYIAKAEHLYNDYLNNKFNYATYFNKLTENEKNFVKAVHSWAFKN